MRTKQVEEFTEAVEVVDIVDEDEQIQQEVRTYTGSLTMWLLRLRFKVGATQCGGRQPNKARTAEGQ